MWRRHSWKLHNFWHSQAIWRMTKETLPLNSFWSNRTHTHSVACRGWQGFNFLENVLSACFCGLRPLEPALLPWRHYPRRISASLVALLHPSLSCATSMQLILIFLISFCTSTFFFLVSDPLSPQKTNIDSSATFGRFLSLWRICRWVECVAL